MSNSKLYTPEKLEIVKDKTPEELENLLNLSLKNNGYNVISLTSSPNQIATANYSTEMLEISGEKIDTQYTNNYVVNYKF
jgi:basic membrane lipoprotein Med (substrate-binding protein (PBP1-ABC) superfamily)